jgi:hypothetical protein
MKHAYRPKYVWSQACELLVLPTSSGRRCRADVTWQRPGAEDRHAGRPVRMLCPVENTSGGMFYFLTCKGVLVELRPDIVQRARGRSDA